jgi:DNA-binding PadR family transcriptional regulator
LNKIEASILLYLRHEKLCTVVSTITTSALSEREDWGIKPETLYRYLRKMVKKGYIKNGLPDGKAKTYYITEHGLRKLEDLENER